MSPLTAPCGNLNDRSSMRRRDELLTVVAVSCQERVKLSWII
ncbi:MAG: hypothetical protein WCO92_05725 [Verrucomicrobiota bacterium]